MSTAIKNGKIKHFVSCDIKKDVRAIFYKEKSAGTMKICAGRSVTASGRRNFVDRRGGQERKYESGEKNLLWNHGRDPDDDGTDERIWNARRRDQ